MCEKICHLPERVPVISATHKQPRSNVSLSPTVVHHHSRALKRDIPATMLQPLFNVMRNWKAMLTVRHKLVDHKNNVYSRLSQVGENLGWVRLHAAVSWAVTGQCTTNGLTPTLTLICGAGTVSPITAQETAPRNPTRPAVSTDLIITA